MSHKSGPMWLSVSPCLCKPTERKTSAKLSVFSFLMMTAIVISLSGSSVSGRRHRRQHMLESLAQTKCLDKCSCKWKSGKMTVECNAGSFTNIPDGLDPGTQVLYMTGNVLQILRAQSFHSVRLNNLQRIYLNRCGITSIDDKTFHSVSNLVELDLSNNFLTSIPTNAIKICPQMRKLFFAHNPITRIANESFAKLVQLQTIDLSDNQIETIEANAFFGLKDLKQLYLSNNRLSYISGHVVQTLPSLYELTLHNNPWNCDCKLRDLRDWMLQHNIPLSYSPNCSTPRRLKDRDWNSLDLDDYACVPTVLSIDNEIVVSEGENASISCVVESIPAPRVDWKAKGREIRNMSLMTFGRQMYLIREGMNGPFRRISTLYIMNALEKDAGSYTCLGANRAGNVSSNTNLTILKPRSIIRDYTGEEVAGIVLGIMFIFLLIFIAICVVVLRSKSHYADINSGNRLNQSSEQNRCQSDERKLLSVHMNHNSYVTSVVTSNHLEMKTISDSDTNHRTNDNKSSDSNEDNNCLMNSINDNHNCFKTTSDMTVDGVTHCEAELSKGKAIVGSSGGHSGDERTHKFVDKAIDSLPNSDNKQFDSNYRNSFDEFESVGVSRDVTNACVPTTSTSSSTKSNYRKTEDLLRRRASDITAELNKRFGQKRHQNSLKESSQPTVRFNNNAIIYNYQCQRFGHSMESLDSDSNGYTHNAYEQTNNYNYANGQVGGPAGVASNRTAGFSYTVRPARGVAKQYRRSGGSLAALLGIDARDSPDEGLGDEREYETDILD